MSSRWTVLLTHQAEQDFAEILRWTTRRFGPEQARTYAGTLSQAIEALSAGPEVVGTRARDGTFRAFERYTLPAKDAQAGTSLYFAWARGPDH